MIYLAQFLETITLLRKGYCCCSCYPSLWVYIIDLAVSLKAGCICIADDNYSAWHRGSAQSLNKCWESGIWAKGSSNQEIRVCMQLPALYPGSVGLNIFVVWNTSEGNDIQTMWVINNCNSIFTTKEQCLSIFLKQPWWSHHWSGHSSHCGSVGRMFTALTSPTNTHRNYLTCPVIHQVSWPLVWQHTFYFCPALQIAATVCWPAGLRRALQHCPWTSGFGFAVSICQ